jgi:uncharacterized protein YceK
MRPTLGVLVLLAALLTLSGCATSANLGSPDGCKVFGGTRLDATLISEGLAPDPDVAKKNELERPVMVYEACCGMIDMPFSILADAVLLPITVPVSLSRSGTDADAAEPAPKKRVAASTGLSAE